jgi:predicted cupin superfamily sugar epimerase
MDARAAQLITSLALIAHPEGGYFREVYRSADRVQPNDGRGDRASLTTIYFLLVAGQVSRWHRVAADEAWHHYEGAALELLTADADFRRVTRERLGALTEGAHPVHVVPANSWQAAQSTGVYTLVGCTVAPGFEFADFQMLDADPTIAAFVKRAHPDVAPFI